MPSGDLCQVRLLGALRLESALRTHLLAATVVLAACGGGAQHGTADLGQISPANGHRGPEAGVWLDGAADSGSAIDRASSPDLTVDTGMNLDLSADVTSGSDLTADQQVVSADADASLDSAAAETATNSRDAGVEAESGGSADRGCALASNIAITKLPAIDFLAYHSQPQIETYLQAVAAALPSIAEYKVLGQSPQGRNVPYLVINATCQANPPAVFANGTHHGDEPSSTESVLAIPDYFLRKSTTDASVRGLLAAYAVYVLPLVNPDGFAAQTRGNADGVDINRDYSYPGRSDADSFKTIEAGLIRTLQESVGFHAAIAYHSGAQEVIWPWCYTGDATADAGFFAAAGKRAGQAMNFSIYQQSYDDYPTQGEYIDYAYWKSRTLAATFEVSTVKAPSPTALAGVVDGACKGTAAWMQAVSDHDQGSLHALPVAPAARMRFPFTAPFDGSNRLE